MNCPDCTSTLFKGKVLLVPLMRWPAPAQTNSTTLFGHFQSPILPFTYHKHNKFNKQKNQIRGGRHETISVLQLLFHNHPGIRSRSGQYLLTHLQNSSSHQHPLSLQGRKTQVLHSSIIIISYTTISTVSFSTTQTEEDVKTQDLIHLRSGTCIFSSIWIYTWLAFTGSSQGREKGT